MWICMVFCRINRVHSSFVLSTILLTSLGWFYTGGTPLFDESTGQRTDRLDYLIAKFPNAPWEQEPPINDDVSNLAKADMWLKEMNLNEYGDEIGKIYSVCHTEITIWP